MPILIALLIALMWFAALLNIDTINENKERETSQQKMLMDAGDINKEEVEAYFAWCKLEKRWDIRLDEWRKLKKYNLLPTKP